MCMREQQFTLNIIFLHSMCAEERESAFSRVGVCSRRDTRNTDIPCMPTPAGNWELPDTG